jgi:hypothetical protein
MMGKSAKKPGARDVVAKPKAQDLSKEAVANPYTADSMLSSRSSYQQLDPNAKVQTGPGLPTWRWHEYQLGWDGPVRQDQQLSLWLLPPWAYKLVVLAYLALLAALLGRIALALRQQAEPVAASAKRGRNDGNGGGNGNGAGAPLMAALLAFSLAVAASYSPPAQAQLPSKETLEELKQKLLRPADCLPECAELSRM